MSMLELQARRFLEEGYTREEVQALLQEAAIPAERARQLVAGLDAPAVADVGDAMPEPLSGDALLGGAALSAGLALGALALPVASAGVLTASVGLVGYGLVRVARSFSA